jgi:hypothetical protein
MNPLKTEDDAFVSEPEHPNHRLDEFVLTDIFQFAHDINCAIEGNVNSSGDVFEYNDFNLINAFTREHPQFKFSQEADEKKFCFWFEISFIKPV